MTKWIVALFLAWFEISHAQPMCNSDYYSYDFVDSLLWEGITQVYAENFDSAFAIFDSVIQITPDSPRGYFFMAAAYSNLAGDYRNLSYAPLFFEYVEKAIKIGERKIEEGKATTEDLFYCGGAVGYRGIFKSFWGDWWGAFKDGLKAKNLLNRSLETDSTNKDIYFGLGAYNYWRSAKMKIFRWLPFFPDRRQQGIKEIKIAIKDGRLSCYEGKYALLRIYYDYEKYESLFELWENDLENLNPKDPFGLYWVGLSHMKQNRFEKALDCFKTILEVYLSSPYRDLAGEMECRYYIGLCLHNLGRYNEALDHLRISLAASEKLKGRKDIEEALNNVESLFKATEGKVSE